MSVSLKTVSNGIQKNFEGMLKRENAMQSFFSRNIYAMYQNAQRKRWETENFSEGRGWEPLEPRYADWKRSKFAAYEGSGTKMLIATGKLYKAVIGPGSGQKKVVTNKGITISISTPYAWPVDAVRPFTEWSEKTAHEMMKAISDFIFKNIQRDITKL